MSFYNDDRNLMAAAHANNGRTGIIQHYIQQNAQPNAKGWRALNKLNDRVTNILDRVALTIGGVQVSHKNDATLKPIEDLLDTEYYEEFEVEGHKLVVAVRFTKTGALRLALVDPTVKPEPKESDSGRNPDPQGPKFAGVHESRGFDPDWTFGIRERQPMHGGFLNKHIMSCEGYHCTIDVLHSTMRIFAGSNKLSYYVQAEPSKDSLVYIFLDNEDAE